MPPQLGLDRPIGGDAANRLAKRLVEALQRLNYTDVRVNQQQLATKLRGVLERVGINRPDIQATTPDGGRLYIEIDTAGSSRGPLHAERILRNDPQGIVVLYHFREAGNPLITVIRAVP